jgi:hypothetical protein
MDEVIAEAEEGAEQKASNAGDVVVGDMEMSREQYEALTGQNSNMDYKGFKLLCYKTK